jgi:hypothetical protein
MLWVGVSTLKRRNCFPSWSCLGWSGEVALPFQYSGAWDPTVDNLTRQVDTQPLVNWYAIRQDGVQCPLDNSYHSYKVDLNGPDLHFPEGWELTLDSEYPEYGRKAVKTEKASGILFQFPTPLSPPLTEDASYQFSCNIQFKADSLTLPFNQTSEADPEYENRKLDLHDDNGNWIGIIQLCISGDEDIKPNTCELIAVSRGCATRRKKRQIQTFREMQRFQHIKSLESYAFYNVLWIEWVEHVAYRKGIGRVWEEAWRLQDTKVIDVELG